MTEKELDRSAEQECSWLHYYGHDEARRIDEYNDVDFYNRLKSIGYCKRVIKLDRRCPAYCISSDKPVLESTIEELQMVSGPRDHSNNVYTPLEYVMYNKIGRYLEFKAQLHS
jgi:hypothetical protein